MLDVLFLLSYAILNRVSISRLFLYLRGFFDLWIIANPMSR